MALLTDFIERAVNRLLMLGLLSLTAPPNILIKLNKISNLIELSDIYSLKYSLSFQFVLGFLELWSLLFRGASRAWRARMRSIWFEIT